MNNSLSHLDFVKHQNGDHIMAVDYPNSAAIFAAICACIFIVVGIAGNLITIIALLQHQKLRGHATTAFVLSLCISDLLFCSFSMPLTAVRYINKAWTLGHALCTAFPVIFYSNVAVSVLSMVGITLNRYILIAHHHLYNRIYRPHSIALQLFLVWFLAFATMVPPLLGIWGTLGLDEKTFSCTILKKNGKSIKKFIFFVGFLLPCVVIIISYSCIYYTVRKQRQKLNKHICSSAAITSATASSKTMGIPAAREREDSRLTAMMLTIFICFLLCFLPISIVNIFDDKHQYPWLNTIASVLAWSSSVINPFIYAASNRTYRVAYFKLFSAMKFWGEPLSPMPSKSFLPSKGSRDNGSNGNFNGKA